MIWKQKLFCQNKTLAMNNPIDWKRQKQKINSIALHWIIQAPEVIFVTDSVLGFYALVRSSGRNEVTGRCWRANTLWIQITHEMRIKFPSGLFAYFDLFDLVSYRAINQSRYVFRLVGRSVRHVSHEKFCIKVAKFVSSSWRISKIAFSRCGAATL